MADHDEWQRINEAVFGPTSPMNPPAIRVPEEEAVRAERPRQTELEAVQQRRAAALAAQRTLAARRARDAQGQAFRAELAQVQARCRQNQRDGDCPTECVVRQWRRGIPLSALNGMEEFRRRTRRER